MNRRRELLRQARKELRQGQHRLGCALWFVQGRAIPLEAEIAARIFLDVHDEFGK